MSPKEVSEPVFEELRPPLSRKGALIEADRCLECGGPYAPAPCMVACPAGVDVAGFIAAIAADDPATAAETIFAENLLGGTCARVCPVEVLCEAACVLPATGRRPIEIAALQRYATDQALEDGDALRTRRPSNGRRVAVIGAGPAGLVCAGELASLGYAVTVFDERQEPGGLVRYAIAPYRQVREPLPQEARALARLGVEFRLGRRIGHLEFERLAQQVDAVFLGIGMGPDTPISYPGDSLPGVWDSLPFIEAIKTGFAPEVGSRVIVIGGGNTAIDVAREARRLGARDVTLVYRRGEAELPAYAHEVAEAREEGVRFRFLAAPVRFLGRRWLEGVECVQMELGEPDESGRRRPQPVEDSEFTLLANTAVKAIGQRPRSELADWIPGLELEHGAVKIDPETGRTTNPKFFAGGDAVNGTSVVEAVRDAKRAAKAIDEWLR
ncbi:MAG: NAD(P)-dependent oxidoreductase [Candidatus Doudnabacteria bacterium]|jgi:dihydropyrimidine dehydrogenase (NAD+) subunit PreT